MTLKNLLILVIIGSLAIACEEFIPSAPAANELLDGPLAGLTNEQNRRFSSGDAAFNGQIFTEATGLGSIFVATSCVSCHAGDGKGHPSTTLTRFGQVDETGNKYLNQGGPQLQHRALPGFTPEQIPAGATFSKFTPPGNTGLGFLELVSDSDILSMSDPEDADGDGISGVPNWINVPPYTTADPNAITQSGKYIGRFGKKAATHNLLQQTVTAYNQDIGITSTYSPYDVYSGLEIDPEISQQTINDVVFYLQTLKAPPVRKSDDAKVLSGKNIFIQIGCESCHRQTLKSGISPIAPLSNKDFHPYTDLLLHDMGSALDDGYTEGSAKTYEWRTPPLWGLGLSPNSQGGSFFLMHDGRASGIAEAINLHGGESSASQQKFSKLSEEERATLIRFLESL